MKVHDIVDYRREAAEDRPVARENETGLKLGQRSQRIYIITKGVFAGLGMVADVGDDLGQDMVAAEEIFLVGLIQTDVAG